MLENCIGMHRASFDGDFLLDSPDDIAIGYLREKWTRRVDLNIDLTVLADVLFVDGSAELFVDHLKTVTDA